MSRGRFGIHGGQFIPETLMSAVTELEEAYEYYKKDPQFKAELKYLLEEYTGRPSRLYYAEKMTKDLGGARIYLKREDLNHTGSHKINNAQGPDSTVWPLPPQQPCWVWNARFTWARRIRTARHLMYTVWSC